MIAQQDIALAPWLYGILNNKPNPSGDFLRSLAEAAVRADHENYPLLRLALLEIAVKYPQYYDPNPYNWLKPAGVAADVLEPGP